MRILLALRSLSLSNWAIGIDTLFLETIHSLLCRHLCHVPWTRTHCNFNKFLLPYLLIWISSSFNDIIAHWPFTFSISFLYYLHSPTCLISYWIPYWPNSSHVIIIDLNCLLFHCSLFNKHVMHAEYVLSVIKEPNVMVPLIEKLSTYKTDIA